MPGQKNYIVEAIVEKRALALVAQPTTIRRCLACDQDFHSTGPDHRRCKLARPRVTLRLASPFAATVGGPLAVLYLSQVESQVWSQVGSQVGSQVDLRSAMDNDWGGQFWASWFAYITFFRDVCGWENSTLTDYQLGEDLQSAGWIWWHEQVCALSDRPVHLCRDARGRLHRADGMAIEYSDGWGLHAWHGVRVPAQVIEQPATLTSQQILSEPNAEIRRVMVERLGLDRFLVMAKAKVLHTDQDGRRVLHRIDWENDEPIVAVQVQCPTTGQTYFLRVPPQIDRCDKAVAWTFGFERVADYHPLIET